MIFELVISFYCYDLFVLSFYAKRKYERKGATNEKSIISFPCRPFPEPGPDMIDLASPSSLRSVHAVCGLALAPSFMNFINIMRIFWISNGLREFWEIATVLKLAARA
ncbi:MAG: hypothetical protein Q7T72_07590 [Bacteroidales bacterium]|nr:hypothetical protein [Bacteroidales bacterium]